MAIQSSDILALMREIGIAPDLVNQLDPALPLVEQGLDSIDLPSIDVAAEKRYGLDLSGASANTLKSINDFVAYINRVQG